MDPRGGGRVAATLKSLGLLLGIAGVIRTAYPAVLEGRTTLLRHGAAAAPR